METYAKGTTVKWNWGSGQGAGEVREHYTQPVEHTIKGESVKRNAGKDNPAYLIRRDDGDEVLKSHSELEKA